MGYNNQDAYGKTFPNRIARMRAEGRDDKHISSFVAAYNKNKLVNMILEQTLIAPWVLNQDVYQKALYVQADLMINSASDKVRCAAAHSILNALKRPETSKINIDIDINENSGLTELKDLLGQAAIAQQKQIENGTPTKEIAHSTMFEGEVTDAKFEEK